MTVFNSTVNEFCRRHLIGTKPIAPNEGLSLVQRWQEIEASLFEELLLFDAIAFKVFGENIPLAMLINALGDYAFDCLVEHEAFRFVLWTSDVMYVKTDVRGLNPLASANFDSGVHSDPEQSIELGLRWMRCPPTPKATRRLLKKLTPLYITVSQELAPKAVNIAHSAYLSGKFERYGLSPSRYEIMELPEDQRQILCDRAQELLEYHFLVERRYSSYSNAKYFHLFSDTVQKLRALPQVSKSFTTIAEIENFPDMKSLFLQIPNALAKIPQFRQRRTSIRFRKWLASVQEAHEGLEIIRAYIHAIAEAKGPLDTAAGKFTKSIVLASIGAGIGAIISGSLEGATWGAVAAKAFEGLADCGLDLLDSFLVEEATKGRTPRMFFDDLKQLRDKC